MDKKPIDLSDSRLKAMSREFNVERGSMDADKRTVELSFASEAPVERFFGNEILECTDKACDLSRLRQQAPLLLNHDPEDQIGVVESCQIKGGKARAVVRFSKNRSKHGLDIFQDVQDGIRSLVSVGYRVKNMVLAEKNTDAGDSYRVDSWEPYEISLVSIPADASVGVGRSQPQPLEKPKTNMSAENTPAAPAVTVAERAPAPSNANVTRKDEVANIRAIGENFKVSSERVMDAIVNGESLDSFRKFVVEDHLKATAVSQPAVIGMNKKEKRRYSLTRAINLLSQNRPLDGLEKEASDAASKQYRREAHAGGFIMPHDMAEYADPEMTAAMLRVSPSLANSRYGQNLQRQLQTNNFAQAGSLVATDFLGGSFIELLRNRTLLTQLGVGTMSGLVGNIAIPRQSGAATAYWLAEGDAVTDTKQSFAQLAATPRRLAARTAYSKQLLAQSSLDAEALVRDDHVRIIAIAKDLAGIQGTGGSQPMGILNGPTTDSTGGGNNITSVTFGTAPTWANVVKFEQQIQSANADLGTMQWLTNPTVRAKWKTTVKVPNYPVFLSGDDNMTNGYPVNITNQIATTGGNANKAIFGAWGQAMFFDWAGYDVVVDPYTQAANNQVVVTVNLFTDFGVRHWPSFCVSTDSAAQ
jgi:HK97 family phage major capsid protein/HK97 family phage prohead protease